MVERLGRPVRALRGTHLPVALLAFLLLFPGAPSWAAGDPPASPADAPGGAALVNRVAAPPGARLLCQTGNAHSDPSAHESGLRDQLRMIINEEVCGGRMPSPWVAAAALAALLLVEVVTNR